jgi:hypothetical protein
MQLCVYPVNPFVVPGKTFQPDAMVALPEANGGMFLRQLVQLFNKLIICFNLMLIAA